MKSIVQVELHNHTFVGRGYHVFVEAIEDFLKKTDHDLICPQCGHTESFDFHAVATFADEKDSEHSAATVYEIVCGKCACFFLPNEFQGKLIKLIKKHLFSTHDFPRSLRQSLT